MKQTTLILLGMAIATGARAQYIEENDSTGMSVDLEETTVVAQRPIVKMDTDKVTYSVQQDPESKAATVLDMLRKVPMVTVDGQDNITVAGSSSFKVYLNGRPNPMMSGNPSQVFKSMPAAMVKNIEVITNPGAKYDAEGTGGVLNIVLRTDLDMSMMMGGGGETIDGINGNIRLGGGNNGGNGSVYVGGNKGKLSFSVNAMTNLMITRGTDVNMTQKQLAGLPYTAIIDQKGGRTFHPFSMGNFSIGYEIDDRNSINATLGMHAFRMKNKGDIINRLEGNEYGNMFGTDFKLTGHNLTDVQRKAFNASADYQHFFDKEHKSSVAVTYQYALNPSETNTETAFDPADGLPVGFQNYLEDRNSYNSEHSDEHTLQTDFVLPINEHNKINTGAKYSRLSANSDAKYYRGLGGNAVLQPDLCTDYSNNRDIAAAYAEYEGKKEKWSGRAGVRYEHTWQAVEYKQGNGADFNINYGNFVPTASLSYAFMPIANIGLSYNMRISRPGISFLNPYADRTSNTSITYGNKDLDVETSHNTGLVFNFFTPKFMCNFNIRYALTPNAIEKYSFVPTTCPEGDAMILHTTYGNIVKKQQASVSLFTSFLAHKNTRIIANLGASYNDFRSTELDAHNSGWQRNIMVGVQQTLPKKWNCGAYLITNSKTYTLQGWNGGFDMLTANISKSFKNDKFNIALQGFTGLAKGGRFHIKNHTQSADFVSDMDISVPVANGTISFTYNFGNSKVRVKKHESKVKSDLMERKDGMEQMGTMGTSTGAGMQMPH